MHIAFLNPQGNFDPEDSYWTEHPDFGGQLVYVKETAIALARLGHRVDILTRKIVDPDWPEFAAEKDAYPDSDVRILRLPCGPPGFLAKEALWPYIGTEWIPNILEFYKREREIPDRFTAHYGDGGLAAALIYRSAGIPFTFTGHSLGAQKMDKLGADRGNLAALDERYNFRLRIFAERVTMAYAGRIITSTHQEAEEQYGHPAYRGSFDPKDRALFSVIPPGVNQDIFSPLAGPADPEIEARIAAALARDVPPERFGLPIVLLSSRLDPKKNHLGVLEAFAASPALREQANLAVVVRGLEDPLQDYGQLPETERSIFRAFAEHARAGPLRGAITAFALDSQIELASAYRVLQTRRSVFCLTALYEPFGLAPLEAMSCGLPAVVTQNGGPSESLQDSGREFGVLVDPEDPGSIASGLLRMVSDPAAWEEFSRAGRKRVEEKYTWPKTAAGYSRALQELTPSPPAPMPDFRIPAYFTDPGKALPRAELEAVYFSSGG